MTFARWSPWISITPSTTLPPDPHRRFSSRASSAAWAGEAPLIVVTVLPLRPGGLAPHAQDAVAGDAPGLHAAGAAAAVGERLAAVLAAPHPTLVRRVDQAHRRPR